MVVVRLRDHFTATRAYCTAEMIATACSAAVFTRGESGNRDHEVASVVSLVDMDVAALGQQGRAHIVESLCAGKIWDSSAARRSISPVLFE
jgi:hypothetical protein